MRRLQRASVAVTVIAIVPLVALLACASGGTARTRPADGPSAGDAASVRDVDASGKSLEDLFAGRFPGVSVTRANGGGLQIRIRGGSNSFYGSNEPLFVVDGTPLQSGTGGIVFLNPYDIERIEVLKNPADITLYGMRGANGVIRITTTRPRKP